MRALAIALPAFALPALLVTGCALPPTGDERPADEVPRACTEEFRTYAVQVVDAQGHPVEGLSSTARVERTGVLLAEGASSFPSDAGHYPVATDADRAHFRAEADAVRFVAEGAGLRAEAVFAFHDDGCHVVKRSGPEQVVAVRTGG